jgi:hypothetical protein
MNNWKVQWRVTDLRSFSLVPDNWDSKNTYLLLDCYLIILIDRHVVLTNKEHQRLPIARGDRDILIQISYSVN